MSVKTWTDPNTNLEYPIGTEGLEHSSAGISGFFANIIRALYPYTKSYSILYPTLAMGLVDWNTDSMVPTYGKWGGPGWGGGARTSQVDWKEPPCYNETVKTSSNPASCFSLVDAICKTHDWRYYCAEEQKKIDHNVSNYESALWSADIELLKNIASAFLTHTYTSPTGEYNEADGTWTTITYGGTFDSVELLYLAKLVPAFVAKLGIIDSTIEERHLLLTILPFLYSNSNGIIWKDNLCIAQYESATKTDAWIVDFNSTLKPINVNILYGTGSTKASNAFELLDGGVIRINGGTANDAIVIYGADNCDSMACSFEIAGGGGLDRYYLDKDYNYKLIDSGSNEIFIEDGNGGWSKISTLFKQTDGTWKTQDGSTALSGNTIILATGHTIVLNNNFQSGDFGINLLDGPTELQPTNDTISCTGNETTFVDDTSANDSIIGSNTCDWIYISHGGGDWAKGNGGVDFIYASTTDSVILEGGDGNDLLFGGGGNDQIFAGNYGEMDDLVQAGETAQSIDAWGEILGGGAGDDFLYGSDRHDVLSGGADEDLIVGGGGDDTIYGDYEIGPSEKVGGIIDWRTTPISDADLIHMYWILGSTNGGNDVIYAGAGNDKVYGNAGDDEIYGGEGCDSLYGEGGSDNIYGGAGNDYILSDHWLPLINLSNGSWYWWPEGYAVGGDYVDGGDGHDYIVAGGGNDMVFGGAGDDKIWGDNGGVNSWTNNGNVCVFPLGDSNDDYLDGGEGNDEICGDEGNDTIFGGDGNDYLVGDNLISLVPADKHGNDYVDGGTGDDTIWGWGGNDTLIGGNGNDYIDGGNGNDYIDGGNGNGYIDGGAGNDTIYASDGNNSLIGGDGDDYIEAGSGNNNMSGGAGNDTVYAGDGNNSIATGEGDDYIVTGAGSNTIDGGAGNDTILAGGGSNQIDAGIGDDYIETGAGDDTIYGGEGNDTYAWGTGQGQDHVYDENGNDTIVFSGLNSADVDFFLSCDSSVNGIYAKIRSTGETLQIYGWWANNEPTQNIIENFQFDDITLTASQIQAMAIAKGLVGTDGNDTMFAPASFAGVMKGLGGDDYLVGSSCDIIGDTIYGGDGNDDIKDYKATTSLTAGREMTLFGPGQETTPLSGGRGWAMILSTGIYATNTQVVLTPSCSTTSTLTMWNSAR